MSEIFGKPWPEQEQAKVPGAMPPRGIFAMQPSSTPKYAKSGSERRDYTDSMARLYLKATPNSREKMREALPDPTSRVLVNPLTTNGYMDFLLTRANHQFSEKMEIVETLTDHAIVYFFGQSAPIFNYSGLLVNSKEDDQAANFYRIYRDLLRGSQLARRKKRVSIRYDSYIATGALVNLVEDFAAENEMIVNFSFSLVVSDLALFENLEYGLVSLQEDFDPQSLVQEDPDFTTLFRPYRAAMVPPEKPAPAPATEETPKETVQYELREPGQEVPPDGGASFDPQSLGATRPGAGT